MKFRIKFRHVEASYYDFMYLSATADISTRIELLQQRDGLAEIEANSKEEAEEIFDEEPFDHLVDEEPYETQGLTIEIIETKEIR